jgi:hypothetical protein
MAFLSSVWSFLSLIIIAWITQRIINYREKKQRIEQTKLSIYMSWMPFLAECYVRAQRPKEEPAIPENYFQKQMEILGSLQIMGPVEAMVAFVRFCHFAELGFANDKDFDRQKFHESFTAFNGSLCCEIHGEPQCPMPQPPL